MTPFKHLAPALILATLLAFGCDSGDNTTPATPPTPTTPTPTPTATADGATAPSAAAPSAAAGSSGSAAPTTAPALTATEAQTKLDQVTQYVKENKLELAETTLKQLEDNKASLPVTVADKLPEARKMLTAAKAGGAAGLTLPGSK